METSDQLNDFDHKVKYRANVSKNNFVEIFKFMFPYPKQYAKDNLYRFMKQEDVDKLLNYDGRMIHNKDGKTDFQMMLQMYGSLISKTEDINVKNVYVVNDDVINTILGLKHAVVYLPWQSEQKQFGLLEIEKGNILEKRNHEIRILRPFNMKNLTKKGFTNFEIAIIMERQNEEYDYLREVPYSDAESESAESESAESENAESENSESEDATSENSESEDEESKEIHVDLSNEMIEFFEQRRRTAPCTFLKDGSVSFDTSNDKLYNKLYNNITRLGFKCDKSGKAKPNEGESNKKLYNTYMKLNFDNEFERKKKLERIRIHVLKQLNEQKIPKKFRDQYTNLTMEEYVGIFRNAPKKTIQVHIGKNGITIKDGID